MDSKLTCFTNIQLLKELLSRNKVINNSCENSSYSLVTCGKDCLASISLNTNAYDMLMEIKK